MSEKAHDDNDEILKLLQARLAMGREKYGHGVRVMDDTREWTVDKGDNDWMEMAVEEVMDGLVYSAAAILKQKKMRQRRFVVMLEYCVKEMETFIYFLQYTGNEEKLRVLKEQLDNTEQEKVGHLSVYSLLMDHPVSETTAIEMARNRVDCIMGSPYVCRGEFKGIPYEVTGDQETDVSKLDELLYRGKIMDYF